jgi:protein tyrosine/serine phosphatase
MYLKFIIILLVFSIGLIIDFDQPILAYTGVPEQMKFIGPRQNIASNTPKEYGFWSFSILKKSVLSRSGQPTIGEFRWLKKKGWKGIIDLRFDGEYNEVADDAKLPGFNKLGFNYLYLPIRDGQPPTEKQALAFLKFVQDQNNQPVHIHCRGGYGRTGTMAALYRFEIDKWPMAKAIAESRLYHGGISKAQEKWLNAWEKNKVRK